jgi:hypothetical protein
MKFRKIYLFAISVLSLAAASSCESSSSEADYSAYTDALVQSFVLSDNDSVADDLSSVYFTINQYGKVLADNSLTGDNVVGEIFNADSLPVGTKTDKLLAEIGFSDPSKVTLYTASDTIEYSSTDSIDFSKPVIMEVIARNGINKKFYEIKVNVHTQVPDSLHWEDYVANPLGDVSVIGSQKAVVVGSMAYWLVSAPSGAATVYTATVPGMSTWAKSSASLPETADVNTLAKFDGNLYMVAKSGNLLRSANGADWGVASEAMTFVNLIGEYAQPDADAYLIAIVSQNGAYHFANSTDGTTWTLGAALDSNFPLSGYTNPISYYGGTMQRLAIVGGKKADGTLTASSWNFDGVNPWQEFKQTRLPKMQGSSVIAYETETKYPDSFWMLMNGVTADNTYSKVIYTSSNKGISWDAVDTLYTMPAGYEARAFSSVYVDSNYFINLMGGRNAGGELNQLWRGRLNKLAFKPLE